MVAKNKREFLESVRDLHRAIAKMNEAIGRFARSGEVQDCVECLSALADHASELSRCTELQVYELADRVSKIEKWTARAPKPLEAHGEHHSSHAGIPKRKSREKPSNS